MGCVFGSHATDCYSCSLLCRLVVHVGSHFCIFSYTDKPMVVNQSS